MKNTIFEKYLFIYFFFWKIFTHNMIFGYLLINSFFSNEILLLKKAYQTELFKLLKYINERESLVSRLAGL